MPQWLVSHCVLTDHEVTRVVRAVDLLFKLTGETRTPRVTVVDLGRTAEGEPLVGQCSIGWLDIELSPRLFSPHRMDPREFMPVMRRHDVSALLYVVAHELAHARDFRSKSMASWEFGRSPGPRLSEDGREEWAESFTEWYLSRGRTSDETSRWYAARADWRKEF